MGGSDLGMTVAEELISSQAKGAVALVLSHIGHEIKLAWGFKKNLRELQSQLTSLNGLLEGAKQSSNNTLLKQWLDMVKDVAYDADDLIDDCTYRALKQRSSLQVPRNSASVSSKAKRWIRTKAVSMKRIGFHFRMAHKVMELQRSIDGIYETANQLGIKPVKVSAGTATSTYCDAASTGADLDEIRLVKRVRDQREWVDDKGLVGRDEDLGAVVKLLCDPTNCRRDLTVVGIVGMPGLGKTSLCKLVSKTEQVKEYFSRQIVWVVVAYNFDLTDLLNKIAESLYGRASNMSDSRAIVENLKAKLNSKMYLLVLDDVWSTLDWESLKNCLMEISGSKGTTILVTSREKKVVGMMETDSYDSDGRRTIESPLVYELKGLNKHDSWFLFKQRMVDYEALAANPEKSEMSSRMLHKCGGVPLAIRALGDLLRDKAIGKWKEIEGSEIWDEDDKNGILPSLQLSFHYLPGIALKRCFAYCAIFPEDGVIEKETLIQMWMGQGLLQPPDEMEAIGDKYFEILLNSSLLLEVDVDIHGNVRTYKMHDLVWYLARVISGGECLHLPKQGKGNDALSEVRHVTITADYDKSKVSLFPKLRTICFHQCFEGIDLHIQLLSEFRSLRVLSLQNLFRTELPDSISNLKHLRYLDISGNRFKRVPDAITKLYHLQTLRIANNRVSYGNTQFPDIPKEVSNLVNLRHICTDKHTNYKGIGIPEGMGCLTALQTVPTIDIGRDWGGKVSELGSLDNLSKTLKLGSIQLLQSKEEAKSLNLSNKRNIDHLSLSWSHSENNGQQDAVFEGLQPADTLTTLEVFGYIGTRFPQWLMGMTGYGGSPLYNLVSLRITNCCKAKGDLNLKNLSSLHFLYLIRCFELSLSFPSDGFQCSKFLEKMEVKECDGIKTLPDMSALSHLRELTMDGMTSQVGLANLSTLSKLSIDHLPHDLDEGAPLCICLTKLTLKAGRASLLEHLPDQLQHLSALQELHISDFMIIESLPEWLQNLTSLQKLKLNNMPVLQFLPSQQAMQCLSKLRTLGILYCPLLRVKCMEGSGSEWFKIAHVPHVDL